LNVSAAVKRLSVGLHRMFARLHGASPAPGPDFASNDFPEAYRAYARATVKASEMLRRHGKRSPQFVAADMASMRLFHHVKKLQGLKKPRAQPGPSAP
jgi:hypothetical protein